MDKHNLALPSEPSSLIELLKWRATGQPEQRAYSFLSDGVTEKGYLTFSELERQARIVAASLLALTQKGERALLIYPSGLEFITAFFGCLYGGIVAVPVYPPTSVRADRALARFRAIAADAQPSLVLTTAALASKIEGLLANVPAFSTLPVIDTAALPAEAGEGWSEPSITRETLAFLQYTSGSTGTPKGVMVSHGNLLHNSSLVDRYCQQPPHAHSLSWLPLYHDLGLIGGIVQPLYKGYESTIMPPASFLQHPVRWLQAISRTRATISGGPNFAYDLCVQKITPEQKAALDLSSWEVAANGAEPVRYETMERFAAAFASCGFRRESFLPCYGLAEATLVVSAGQKATFPVTQAFQASALADNQVVEASGEADSRTLVSIGHVLPDEQVVIVDLDTLTPCPPTRVGEIWVSSPSVAQGYWQHPTETESTFRAHLTTTNETAFLRTGDLGFLHNGELFITGRLKDLLIIRGSNHYPQDIERTVEQSHPGLRQGCGAAFAVDVQDEERLVVVYEVERAYLSRDPGEIINSIRRAVAEEHALQVYAVVLVKTATIPKTSSGKIQRRACREEYLAGGLDVVARWTLEVGEEPARSDQEAAPALSPARQQATETAIQDWLITRIADYAKISEAEIDVDVPIATYGVDSLMAVSIAADMEEWLGYEFAPTLVYDYPTIRAIARHIAQEPVAEMPVSGGDGADRYAATEAIAIIGLGCRFPGADNPQEFWQLLRDGGDAISEVPPQRWDLRALYDPAQDTPGKMYTRWGGFLSQVDLFDPYFFRISPREATRMDPQQRLLLEVAWEALEHAALSPDTLVGSETGVFIGISSSDYSRLQFSDPAFIDAYAGTGNAHSIAANRLSYVFDFRGPSLAIDTACSSSLVAVHLACQSLRNGECSMALAGGVNVMLSPELTIAFSQAHMMSADGRCKTFDADADGYVRGEGCGLVVLKPLSRALKDGDRILAVIRGSAINQDGRSNGLTAPNGPSQEAVILQALHNAAVAPTEVSYVETHGSSTPLGDPIEVGALKATLMPGRSLDQPCVLGSVKTNIGHLEAAAGIAGLIKTVLALQHREIPPHLHFKKLNPHISLTGTSFIIPTERRPWVAPRRLIAGVSAFGFGGTNAHVILEEAPASPSPSELADEEGRFPEVFTLSAPGLTALQTLAGRYASFLAMEPQAPLADVCFTANTGRARFSHRLAIVASSSADLREQLAAFAAGQSAPGSSGSQTSGSAHRKVAFLFTGQGSQYPGMGRQLYETQPAFRAALERCDRILSSYLEQPLLSVLYGEHPSPLLNETAYTQPALFALEYALAEMWRSWGVEPALVMGHSVGEYVAACIAGAFSLEDGLRLIVERGRLMQSLPQHGAMAVVFANRERVAEALRAFQHQVSLAAINGPENTVISGEREAVQVIVQQVEAQGLATYPLTVSHAFHSPLMDPMLDAFEQAARQIEHTPLRIPLVSNLTGQVRNAGETLDAGYWRQQTRQAVQFAASVQTLVEQGATIFLEIGPDATLSNMGRQCVPQDGHAWLCSLRKGREDWQEVAHCAAALYESGMNLDWAAFGRGNVRRRLALPTYPFERERCWFEVKRAEQLPAAQPAPPARKQGHPLLESHVEVAYPAGTHVWETLLDSHRFPYLNDHRIQGAMALPISVFIELAQAAAVEVLGPGTHILSELELRQLLLLPERNAQRLQVIFARTQEQLSFQVYSHPAGREEQPRHLWTLHASGKIYPR